MNRKRHIAFLLILSLAFTGCVRTHGALRSTASPLYNQAVTFGSVRYVPLLKFCEYYNLDWNWDLASQRIELKDGRNVVVLRPNSYFALVNNKFTELDYPVQYKSGAAYLPVTDALFLSKDVFGIKMKPPVAAKALYQINTVVIDPGHGGKDPGATRYGLREKNIVLDVCKRLKNELTRNGLKVYLTRERDVFIPLRKRAEFANKKGADLFISVHANAARQSRARGFEVFYLSEATDDNARALAAAENASLEFEEAADKSSKSRSSADATLWDLKLTENRRQSKELAYYICNYTSKNLGMKKRGVKAARFAVLKGAVMPSVLVEVGFLTNKSEASKLRKSSFRDRIANAVSRSILAYRNEFERTDGFSR